jgi:hypothetical protein
MCNRFYRCTRPRAVRLPQISLACRCWAPHLLGSGYASPGSKIMLCQWHWQCHAQRELAGVQCLTVRNVHNGIIVAAYPSVC